MKWTAWRILSVLMSTCTALRARARGNPTSQESATVLAAGGNSWLLADTCTSVLVRKPLGRDCPPSFWGRDFGSAGSTPRLPPPPPPGGLTGASQDGPALCRAPSVSWICFHAGTLSHHPALSYGEDSSGNDPPEQKGGLSTTHRFQTGTNR